MKPHSKDPCIHLPFSIRRHILSILQPIYYPKKSILLVEGLPAQNAWYLKSGLAKQYTYNTKGDRDISAFYTSGDIIVDQSMLFDKTLAAETIELIEDSWLFPINLLCLLELLDTFPETRLPFLRLICIAGQNKALRSRMLLNSAKESYLLFKKHYPVYRIMNKDIASYLRHDPTTTSQLRKLY